MALIRYFINVHLCFCTYDQEVTLITERYSIYVHDINSLTNQYVRLFVLRLIIPVNNFSAMSERDGQIGVHKKISTVFVMKRGELS